jgi:hypothetical protein
MTRKHVFLVFTNANDGLDDELHEWYSIHVQEVVDEIDGFVSGQRYELADSQRPQQDQPPWKYLAVYELDTNDLDEVHRANQEAVRNRVFTRDEARAVAREHVAWVYTPVGERVTRRRP